MEIFSAGTLAAYHGKCAIVQTSGKDKIDIRIEGGASKSVRPKDLEFIHPGPCPQFPAVLADPPDPGEVRELAGEETLSFRDFCELLYSDFSPQSAWNGYLMLKEGLYFTGSPAEGVKARPQAEVDAALNAVREKERAREAYRSLLDRIRGQSVLPEDRQAMCEIETFARGASQGCRILKDLGIELLPEKAQDLLVRLGIWADTENPIPLRLGVDMDPPGFALPPLPEEDRVDLTGQTALAIDNASSNDPDDAIGYEDGLLWVHVADPAAVITPGSEADLAASAGGENLYLPDRVLTILPEAATARFGLGLEEVSPALSFGIRIDDSGEPHLEKLHKSRVRVERLTYETAAPRMEEEPLASIRAALERFRAWRLDRGALLIRLPEVHIRLQDGEITIEPLPVTPERELVANAMLAAGAAVASFAVEHELPMPFAAQTPPEERLEGESLSAMYQQRKLCTPGYLTTLPEPHAGLGLDAYVRVTSPLRRYADLLAHQQLRRWLDGLEPLSAEELEDRFIPAEKEAAVRRKAERLSNEFMTLVWLARHPEWTGRAVAVNRMNDSTTLLIPELAYEFKSRACQHSAMDDELTVKLVAAEPPMLLARFNIVR
ncbi:MAG: RNB domain-containing ribonuclease [Lentisphaeria bacterium]|nr:RNB domain-containing ribonuclease [Lentisphaeria bacterium]